MYKMVFANITVGPAFFDASGVTLSKPLTLSGDATAATHAVTKSQLDAVNARVSEIVAAAGTDFDTFVEIKSFMETADANGVTTVMNAVTTEVAARIQAVSDEEAARDAAILVETNARIQAVSDEEAARDAAILVETNARIQAVSDEASARGSANDALSGRINSEVSARELADGSLSDRINSEAATRLASDTVLSNSVFSQFNVPLQASVYADGFEPIPIPSSILNAGLPRHGWYFRNVVKGNKINWYLSPPIDSSTGFATAGSLLEVALPVRLISTVSRPFITVYTVKGATGNAGSWYKAKYTYAVESALTANKDYLLRFKFLSTDACVINEPGLTNVDLIKATSSLGLIESGDAILALSIGTDSGSSAGNVECVIFGCKMLSTNGNAYHTFSNSDVMNKYLMAKVAEIYATFGQGNPSV